MQLECLMQFLLKYHPSFHISILRMTLDLEYEQLAFHVNNTCVHRKEKVFELLVLLFSGSVINQYIGRLCCPLPTELVS